MPPSSPPRLRILSGTSAVPVHLLPSLFSLFHPLETNGRERRLAPTLQRPLLLPAAAGMAMDDSSLIKACVVGGNAVSAFLSWRLQATNACDVTLVWKSGFDAVSQFGITFKYVRPGLPPRCRGRAIDSSADPQHLEMSASSPGRVRTPIPLMGEYIADNIKQWSARRKTLLTAKRAPSIMSCFA